MWYYVKETLSVHVIRFGSLRACSPYLGTYCDAAAVLITVLAPRSAGRNPVVHGGCSARSCRLVVKVEEESG